MTRQYGRCADQFVHSAHDGQDLRVTHVKKIIKLKDVVCGTLSARFKAY